MGFLFNRKKGRRARPGDTYVTNNYPSTSSSLTDPLNPLSPLYIGNSGRDEDGIGGAPSFGGSETVHDHSSSADGSGDGSGSGYCPPEHVTEHVSSPSYDAPSYSSHDSGSSYSGSGDSGGSSYSGGGDSGGGGGGGGCD